MAMIGRKVLIDILFKQIEHMDALFEAQFSPLADSGKPLSKCGKCSRYMKYIAMRPSRLYCASCEEVHHLPQNGAIKVFISYDICKCLNCAFSGNEKALPPFYIVL
jgi:hypothetical protein